MSFQGHIENGVIVLDEPVSLPDGTVVRIEPVKGNAESNEPQPLPGRGKGMLTIISEDDDHLKDFAE